MKSIELFPMEMFYCPLCNAPFYVRVMFLETTNTCVAKFSKEAVSCPGCKEIVDIMDLQLDQYFHFNFQCEDCGEENRQTSFVPCKIVKCNCGQRYESVIGKQLSSYWGKKSQLGD